MTLPRIAVIIVNWNNQADTLACLGSLLVCQCPDLDIIVVDNASTDGSADAISAKMPQGLMIRNQNNLGFTGGNNIGMKAAFERGADYVFLLNNDAEIAMDVPETLVEFMENNPEVWATAPMIYYHSQPNVIWSAGGRIDYRRGTAQMLGTDQIDTNQFGNSPYSVDFATGCALMVRRSAVERFGLLDDRFFMYYEEVEWCTRMHAQGLKVVVVPNVKVWHKIIPDSRNESPFVHYLMTRNRLLWVRSKYFGRQVFWRILLLENLRTLFSWTFRPRWNHKRAQRQAMLQAIMDVFRKRYGPPKLKNLPKQQEYLLEGNIQ